LRSPQPKASSHGEFKKGVGIVDLSGYRPPVAPRLQCRRLDL
jgi:hypothetical protein